MRRVAILLLAVASAGCMAMVPDDMQVTGFEDVHDAPDFWVRIWEITYREEGIDFAGAPQAFKDCTGEEASKMSPPNLNQAVERFIATKRAGDYKALLPLVRNFSEGYEQAYGVKPGVRAGELCKDTLQAS
jgi:hypothetical protein